MVTEAEHKKLEESLYRKKRAFTVLFIFFILLVGCAAGVAASVCANTQTIVDSEDNTLANDSLACFAITSAFCFAFFIVFSSILYMVFAFMNPKTNEDSIKYSRVFWITICVCTVAMVVVVCTQSFGNEDLFSCIRNELKQDPITTNHTGQLCFTTTWFVAFSAALLFTMLGLIINIRVTLINALLKNVKTRIF